MLCCQMVVLVRGRGRSADRSVQTGSTPAVLGPKSMPTLVGYEYGSQQPWSSSASAGSGSGEALTASTDIWWTEPSACTTVVSTKGEPQL